MIPRCEHSFGSPGAPGFVSEPRDFGEEQVHATAPVLGEDCVY
jgi:hypothetical protein